MAYQSPVGRQFQVLFVKGRSGLIGEHDELAKIAFIDRNYRGDAPKEGEEWLCKVIKDSKPETGRSGFIILHPIQKVERKEEWTLSTVGRTLLGAEVPKLTRTIRVGSKTVEQSEWEGNEIKAHLTDAGCPADVRQRASEMLAARAAAEERFRQAISWPKTTSAGEHDMEVLGTAGKLHCRVVVTTEGIVRQMSWMKEGVEIPHAPEVLTDKVRDPHPKGTPGRHVEHWLYYQGAVKISSREQLDEVVSLFGAPHRIGWGPCAKERADNWTPCVFGWTGLELAVEPAILFDGQYTTEVANLESDGDAKVMVKTTAGSVELAVPMDGFEALSECQPEVVFWQAGQWTTGRRCATELDQWRPMVSAARPNWAAVHYLPPAQQASLFARAHILALADHTTLFRTAVLRFAKNIKEDAEFLLHLCSVPDQGFSIGGYHSRFSAAEYEPLSPDERRGGTWHQPAGGTSYRWIDVARHARQLPCHPEGGTAAEQAMKSVEQMGNGAKKSLDQLRSVLVLEAEYEGEPPTYTAPEPTIDRVPVDTEVANLLSLLERAVDAANNRLAGKTLKQSAEAIDAAVPAAEDEVQSATSDSIVVSAEGASSVLHKQAELAPVPESLTPAEQAEAEGLTSIFEWLANNLEAARTARKIALAAVEACKGDRARALTILESELDSPSDHRERQGRLKCALGLEDVMFGVEQFEQTLCAWLGLRRPRDFSPLHHAAVILLKSQTSGSESVPATDKPATASPNPSTTPTETNDANRPVDISALTFGGHAQSAPKGPKAKKGNK